MNTMTESDFVTKLAERLYSFMLELGYPVKIQNLAWAFELPRKPIISAMKLLSDSNKVQVGMKGWRAL